MHAVARNVAQRFAKKAPQEFGTTFSYNKVYYSTYNENPVTVEEFVEGEFTKYVNNDGNTGTAVDNDLKIMFKKAETLVHVSYIMSDERFMLLDIQGSCFQLHDPEISTTRMSSDNEIYFCSGNLSTLAIEQFKSEHKCSGYCRMMQLKPFMTIANEDDSGSS